MYINMLVNISEKVIQNKPAGTKSELKVQLMYFNICDSQVFPLVTPSGQNNKLHLGHNKLESKIICNLQDLMF